MIPQPNQPTEHLPEVIWTPNPGPQTRFLSCPFYEVLYGGAAGGGKSDALLIDALGQIAHRQYRALILRRSFPELRELITRSRELYPIAVPGAYYNKTDKTWVFPSGASVEFGYIDHDDDVLQYQGRQFTYIGWDELTHYSEYAYTYMMSRNRTTAIGLICYMRATTNPGGPGHNWVKARFIDAAPPGQPVYDEQTGEYRVFIPSKLVDNPHLARTSYGSRLKALPDADRKALLEGDWNAYEGSVFDLKRGIHIWTWDEFRERTGSDTIPLSWNRFKSMDWGYARPYAIYWYAVDHHGRAYVYRELYGIAKDSRGQIRPNEGIRQEPEKVAETIAMIEREAGERQGSRQPLGVADPACWAKGKGDFGGGPSIIESMAKQDVFWTNGKNDRIQGKIQVHNRLFYEQAADGSIPEWPGLVIIGDECPHLIRTLPSLEYDDNRVEDVDTDGEDHAYDSLRYFCMSRPWAPPVPLDERERAKRDMQQRAKSAQSWMQR